ncbi:MAG: calcium-binding protein, partial [Leptolyngbya sp. SIO4C1]|nr:calcium-binding protein [Leptolyngbya sp. SIO4C1]
GTFGIETLRSIESISGSRYDDEIIGDGGDNRLLGADGDDTILGGDGNDSLAGGRDNDTLDGGTGDDTLSGGSGDDSLTGGAGNDILYSYEDNDVLYGGAGADVLHGHDGNDILVGNTGFDRLLGGAGADTFVFDGLDAERDGIGDFTRSQGDIIQVSASGFGGDLTQGVLGAEQFVLGSAATDSNDRFIYDQAKGILSFDVDGSGSLAAVQIASIGRGTALAHTDIVVA